MHNSRTDFAPSVEAAEAMDCPEGIAMHCTINDVLRLHPATVAVFNEFAIDACCGGHATIGDAAVRDGADAERLLAALRSAGGTA